MGQRGTVTTGVLVLAEISSNYDILELSPTILDDLETASTNTLSNIIPKESISFNPDYINQIDAGSSDTMEIEVDIPPDILNETIYDGTITFFWKWIDYQLVEHHQTSDVPIHVRVRNPAVNLMPTTVYLVTTAGTAVNSSVTITNVEEDVPWALKILDLNATVSDLTSNGSVIPSSDIELTIPADTTIPQGESRTIGITINVDAGRVPGVYTGELLIHTKQQTFVVPVSLQVVNFRNITRPFEIARIDINSPKVLDVTGDYSSSFSSDGRSGTISFTIIQNVKGTILGASALYIVGEDFGFFILKGKLRLKAKTGELKIKLNGKGIDPTTGQRLKLKADGLVDDALVLDFLYKGPGKGNKFEFEFSQLLVNPERGGTVFFLSLEGKGKRLNKVKGAGELLLPYLHRAAPVIINETIYEKVSKRNYSINGFKFKLKLNTEESGDELDITKAKCKVGYGKIPLTPEEIELKYLPIE